MEKSNSYNTINMENSNISRPSSLMQVKFVAVVFLAAFITACQSKTSSHASQNDSLATTTTDAPEAIPNESIEADTMELRNFVTVMYNDILKLYRSGELNGMVIGFKKYASESFNKTFDEAEKVNNETGYPVLGWGCDPWVLAQDSNQPEANVIKVFRESADKGYVDVVVRDGDNRLYDSFIRLLMIKEKGEWKVDDFIGTESADYAPTYCEALREDMEEVLKNAK